MPVKDMQGGRGGELQAATAYGIVPATRLSRLGFGDVPEVCDGDGYSTFDQR